MSLKSFFRKKGTDESFLQEKVNWLILRGFGSSKLASATAIMPFLGYVILYNTEISKYFGELGGLLNQQQASESCPQYISLFSKINLMYLGLFFTGLSAILFKALAPKEIQMYPSANEFIENERKNLTARRLRSMYRTINSKRPRIGGEIQSSAPWVDKSISIKRASVEFSKNDNEDTILDILRNFFQVQSRHQNRGTVLMSALFLILGAILLAIPSTAFTLRVMCTIFHS
ncbi:hypothetical protein M9H61_08440 [Thalassospira sp. GO-4]|jgi:hypothetical protein|uniref:hypothetical protein n=1 Tax=Thalassospira sp. GO-4 TaxID=2946605 RepID=UPI0020240781|nr:hypothetical protein [Thalassospira sp. GO-4]URK19519.1 hypothetical protein M9H61_08440 [Thalassospira sp. GO-4]